MSPTFTPSSRRRGDPRAQRGIALITSVMLLVVITLLAISMFKGFGVQEKLAGNTLEKQRSFQAAQTALQYGEWWLSTDDRGTGVPCTANVDASTNVNLMRVCDSDLSNPITNRTGITQFQPSSMTVATGGGKAVSGVDINYADKPALHVAYVGLNVANERVYRVTGIGYGGTGNSVSVVQSTYSLKAANPCLSCPEQPVKTP